MNSPTFRLHSCLESPISTPKVGLQRKPFLCSARCLRALTVRASGEGRGNPFGKKNSQKEVSSSSSAVDSKHACCLARYNSSLRPWSRACVEVNATRIQWKKELIQSSFLLQEEARKALQGLFKGKADTLAAYDPTEAGGGGGKGGGGKKGTGGGGDGGKRWQAPDWREWWGNLSRRAASGLKVFLAVLGFIGTSANASFIHTHGYRLTFSPLVSTC